MWLNEVRVCLSPTVALKPTDQASLMWLDKVKVSELCCGLENQQAKRALCGWIKSKCE
jgi:hypothetical protein